MICSRSVNANRARGNRTLNTFAPPIRAIFALSVGLRVPDAHRGDGKWFVVRADEKLTAFLELESVMP